MKRLMISAAAIIVILACASIATAGREHRASGTYDFGRPAHIESSDVQADILLAGIMEGQGLSDLCARREMNIAIAFIECGTCIA